MLLCIDGFGAALFATAATEKVLGLGHSAPTAVMLGVWTGIGGGIARDVLAGRQTPLVSREIYATPILLGSTGVNRFIISSGFGAEHPRRHLFHPEVFVIS